MMVVLPATAREISESAATARLWRVEINDDAIWLYFSWSFNVAMTTRQRRCGSSEEGSEGQVEVRYRVTYCYFAYQAYLKKHIGLVIYFVMVAILFNPLKKVWLGKEMWHKVDYVVALITAITIIFDWKGEKKS